MLHQGNSLFDLAAASDRPKGTQEGTYKAHARSLLVSHWPVDSAATVKLTTSASTLLRTIRAKALRRTIENRSFRD
jgi:hypothetical protein